MAISAIFFLDVKGRVIVYRDFRGDVSPKSAERFITRLNELEENSKQSPIIQDEGVTYIYLQVSNLYILAVTRTNVNAAAVVVFLHSLVDVFKHYFQVSTCAHCAWQATQRAEGHAAGRTHTARCPRWHAHTPGQEGSASRTTASTDAPWRGTPSRARRRSTGRRGHHHAGAAGARLQQLAWGPAAQHRIPSGAHPPKRPRLRVPCDAPCSAGAGGGITPGQLCHRLRAPRRGAPRFPSDAAQLWQADGGSQSRTCARAQHAGAAPQLCAWQHSPALASRRRCREPHARARGCATHCR